MTRRIPEEERRRLFRQMEWVFVYGPPVLIVLIAAGASALLAAAFRLGEAGFWARWAIAMVLVLVIPAAAYAVHALWQRRGGGSGDEDTR